MLNRRVVLVLVLLVTLLTPTLLSLVGCEEDPVAACDGNCGSGDVYWDESAERCRDRDNGRFVKSCCCGR